MKQYTESIADEIETDREEQQERITKNLTMKEAKDSNEHQLKS